MISFNLMFLCDDCIRFEFSIGGSKAKTSVMKSQANLYTRFLLLGVLSFHVTMAFSGKAQSIEKAVRSGLTFHASFDKGIEADFATGNPSLHTITTKNPSETIRRGLHAQGMTEWVREEGMNGGAALKFNERNAPWIFYSGEKNVEYRKDRWEGSVSLWLKLNPETDLAPGFADPLQLTTRAWNDGAFFVDFNKEGDPRDFRLGVFADLNVWNPENKEVPEDQRPLFPVHAPPFGRDQWTHVLFTWENFNTGEKNGVAKLYMNGEFKGAVEGWNQTFTWKDEESVRLYLGLNYIGLLDEVSCFQRALSAEEAVWIHENPTRLRELASR